MSTTVSIAFPWGRFHATPWGHHVNEALIEWPPSPWRILRALYATWRARAPHLPESTVASLLTKLALPPEFVVPAFTDAHTRHFMPDIAGGKDKALDAFAVLDPAEPLVVTWDADLTAEERDALAELTELLPYLGRAESICQARLEDSGPQTCGSRIIPLHGSKESDDSLEAPVYLLVPNLPLDFSELTARTTAIRRGGYIDPSGAHRVPYGRPTPVRPEPPVHRRPVKRPTAVRWALSSPARPSVHAAVAVADILRQACLSRYGRSNDGRASVSLTGKDASGAPLSGHCHAHYFALDDDHDRLLDHVILWVPDGLSPDEVDAISSLRRLTGFGHISDFRPARLGLEALGDIEVVAPEFVAPATTWKSLTPFAPSRHPKRHTSWPDHVDAQARAELTWRGLPEPTSVNLLDGDWLSFRRHRPTNERLEAARRAVGVELEFEEPVLGPLALGALSHFGLGLFVPV